MKREIVFRVWDSEQKRFLYSNVDELRFDERGWSIGEYNLYSELKFGVNDNYDNALLQQFTGLKDKNGKEIYEGDILEGGLYENGVVTFENGTFTVWGQPLGWDVDMFDEKPEILLPETWANVIGNIHENPELLNQK